MTDRDALYAEFKPDLESLATPLFDFSELCLKERGNFLPHAAILAEDGKVKLVAAAPDAGNDRADSTEVLPVLHQLLRRQAAESPLRAIGVAENVAITPEGQTTTQAIKALVEHRRGLTVALYLPFRKKLFKGYVFGSMFSISALPEINAWQGHAR
jgi:hypothetical protein